jgi:hypothetical protein
MSNRLRAAGVIFAVFQSLVTNPEQQRRSWYMFYFQLPMAEAAVSLNDFAFIERLRRGWSPSWDVPMSIA